MTGTVLFDPLIPLPLLIGLAVPRGTIRNSYGSWDRLIV